MPTVGTNGVETYYEARGPADAPAVVCLHGAGGDHRVWAEVADPLTDEYRVVVPDMRLHGKTGGDPDADLSIDTYVDDLRALVDALDLDRPAVVGLSMGGMVAQRYVDRYSDAASAVVTLGATTNSPRSRVEWLTWNVVHPVADRLESAVGREYAMKFMDAVVRLRGDDAEHSDMAERERIEAEHEPDYPEQSDEAWASTTDALDGYEDLDVDYAAIDAPFCYMYGENELDTMADHAEFVTATVPESEAREIPGAGHHSHVDNPEFVMDALRDVLDEHVARERARESA